MIKDERRQAVPARQTVPNKMFRHVGASAGPTSGATGDKHIATEKTSMAAPAPKETKNQGAGYRKPMPAGRVSGHNMPTSSSSPKATDKVSRKMAGMAAGLSALASARGKAAKHIVVRPEGAVKKDLVPKYA